MKGGGGWFNSWGVGLVIFLIAAIACLVFASINQSNSNKMNDQLKDYEKNHEADVKFANGNANAMAADKKAAEAKNSSSNSKK